MTRRQDYRSPTKIASFSVALLGLLVSMFGHLSSRAMANPPPKQTLSMAERMMLANRFRPFIMTSLNGNSQESYRPTTWQAFVGTTELRQGYVGKYCVRVFNIDEGSTDDWPEGSEVIAALPPQYPTPVPVTTSVLKANPAALLQLPHGDFSGINANVVYPAYALHVTEERDQHGEDWSTVLSTGDGVYAHVERVLDSTGNLSNFYNIEYTVLWAYNSATCDHHSGDITTIVVLYNSDTDLISRVSYAPHDQALETFELADAAAFDFYPLRWKNLAGNVASTDAVAITLDAAHQYQQGSEYHSPGDPVVYLVMDPNTGRYEHPVAMAETGGHELWPNTGGKMVAAGAHWAEGLSFLPTSAAIDPATGAAVGMQMLERDDEASPNAPLVFFNGLIGTDGNPPPLHYTWYWPETRTANTFGLPDNRFSGKGADPYQALSAGSANMQWPPVPDFVNGPGVGFLGGITTGPRTYAVAKLGAQPKGRQGVGEIYNAQLYYPTTRLNDSAHPFTTLMQALSMIPCGGTLSIRPGQYRTPNPLVRQCPSSKPGVILTAPNGGVILTQGVPPLPSTVLGAPNPNG